MLYKTFLKKIFFSLLIVVYGNAYIIDKKKVTPDLFFVQVGAFSHQTSVDTIRKKLKKFPLLIVKKDNLIKLYVVSKPKYKKGTLRKIRKYIPDAFVIKNRKNIFLIGDYQRSLSENASSENQINLTAPLDAKAILQTRKKFF